MTLPGDSGAPGAGEGATEGAGSAENLHLTTFTHDGRFWDVYLEFVEDARRPDSCRARLCYVPTDDSTGQEPARTAVIIIEPTYDEALEKARALDRHSLGAMLRSAT